MKPPGNSDIAISNTVVASNRP
jgi:hypothetical protein